MCRMIPVILSLMITSCSMLTSPSSVPLEWEDTIDTEWVIAHNDLKARGVPELKLQSVQKHDFSWKEMPGVFECGGVQANGCYTRRTGSHSLIRWNKDTPSALRHEIGHGILDKLGYSCWNEYQHTERSCP